jgi:hypothetical protein
MTGIGLSIKVKSTLHRGQPSPGVVESPGTWNPNASRSKNLRELGLVQLAVMLGMVGLGVAIYRARRDRPPRDRLWAAAVPVLLATLAWHWLVVLVVLPDGGPWSGIRLAPAMSLWYGYRLYEPPDTGLELGWVYPPVGALAYLPVTLIGDPTLAPLAGRCLTMIYDLGPVVWLILSAGTRRDRQARWVRLLLLLTFALLTTQSRALSYCSTEVHADAPALGLGALALGLLGRCQGPADRARRWGAIVLAALAVWSKQLMAPVFGLLPLWVLVREGLGPALRFGLAWVVGGLAIGLAMIAAFPPRAMLFHILEITRQHPWNAVGLLSIAGIFFNKMEVEHVIILMLAAAGLACRPALREATSEDRPAAWPLFLAAGLVQSPLAILGLIKKGGHDNQLAFSLYFLAIGTVLLLVRVLERDQAEERREGTARLPLAILGVDLVLALIGTQWVALRLAMGQPTGPDPRVVVRYLRAHPGEAYFPWNPLEHLMVERRATHSEYGVYDRELANVPLSRTHFLQYVPPRARRICYPEGITVAEQITLRYAGGHWERTSVRELPGWICFERKDGGPAFPELDRPINRAGAGRP